MSVVSIVPLADDDRKIPLLDLSNADNNQAVDHLAQARFAGRERQNGCREHLNLRSAAALMCTLGSAPLWFAGDVPQIHWNGASLLDMAAVAIYYTKAPCTRKKVVRVALGTLVGVGCTAIAAYWYTNSDKEDKVQLSFEGIIITLGQILGTAVIYQNRNN